MSARASCWGHAIIKAGVLEKSLSPKLVLLAICDRADASGKCSHSSASISDGLFISETTVKSAIKFMQARGVLKIIRRQSEDCNVNLSNLYLLQIPAEFAKDALLASAARGVGQIPPQGGGIRPGSESDPGLKSTKIKSKSKRARDARACAPASAGDAAAAEPVKKGNENKAFRIINGVECWTQDDPASAASLVSQHGLNAVEAVASAFSALGIPPLPSRVAKELQRRAAAAQARKDSEVAEARVAAIEAESRRRADRDMAELMAPEASQTSKERDL